MLNYTWIAAPAALLILSGCAHHERERHHEAMASAKLQSAASEAITGMVMLHDDGGHVMLHAKISGLKPNSVHGFHVHEKGDCSKADFSSAGGHFNPDKRSHGTQEGEHHAGDMPNLSADSLGNVDVKLMLHDASLKADSPNHIVGRAFVIHANADDYQTQPAGNSGPRIACGVIETMMK